MLSIKTFILMNPDELEHISKDCHIETDKRKFF